MELIGSALKQALAPCHECGKVAKIPLGQDSLTGDLNRQLLDEPNNKGRKEIPEHLMQASLHCPRCGKEVHLRKAHAISRTWALVLLGFGVFVISHVYPVLTMTQLGQGSVTKTIIGGVLTLVNDGFWGIAAILFFASFVIPLIKLIGLVWILLAVQLSNFDSNRRMLGKMYRLIKWIGRWSMLDIFVLTIWASLIQMGGLATVEAEIGSSAFGILVVITMIAVATFDPRLIWDKAR